MAESLINAIANGPDYLKCAGQKNYRSMEQSFF